MLTERQTQEFHDEVAMPAYRQFCKDYGFKFRDLDNHAEPQFNPMNSPIEYAQHLEAMALFNRLRSTTLLFRNQVVKLTLSPGSPPYYEAETVEFFLQKHSELRDKLAATEKRYQLLQLAFGITCFFLLSGLWSLFPPQLCTEFAMMVFGLSLIVFWITGKLLFQRIQRNKKDQEEQEIVTRLERLRVRLEEPQRRPQ